MWLRWRLTWLCSGTLRCLTAVSVVLPQNKSIPSPFISIHICYRNHIDQLPASNPIIINYDFIFCIVLLGFSRIIFNWYVIRHLNSWGSRDNAVDKLATAWTVEGLEFEYRFFFSPRCPGRFWGPSSLLTNGYPGLFPRGLSVRGVKLTTCLQLVPRSRILGSIHPLPHTSSWHNAYLVKHSDNFAYNDWSWKIVLTDDDGLSFNDVTCIREVPNSNLRNEYSTGSTSEG
jgi:hypothetical protein